MLINIFQARDYRAFLSALLRKRSLKNPSYSLRAFARDIDIAPGFLSLILNSKKSLSNEKADSIASRLDLLEHEREYFVALVEKERSGDDARLMELRRRHAFEYLDETNQLPTDMSLKEFALLQQIALLGPVQESGYWADRFELPMEQFSRSCRRLAQLGWLQGCPETSWASHRGSVRAEGYPKSESIRVFHQKVLEMGLHQLHSEAVEDRFFNSFVFSFSYEQYQTFCAELEAFFMARCDAFSTRESHDRIYALGLQLLPIAAFKREGVAERG